MNEVRREAARPDGRTRVRAAPRARGGDDAPVAGRAGRGHARFVRGVAVVRGAPVPVVDLGALLGGARARMRASSPCAPGRAARPSRSRRWSGSRGSIGARTRCRSSARRPARSRRSARARRGAARRPRRRAARPRRGLGRARARAREPRERARRRARSSGSAPPSARLGLQFEDARLELLADVARERRARRSASRRRVRRAARRRRRREVRALAERLTVGETYFFRNTNDLRAFVDVVLPERMRARAGERSCGSSPPGAPPARSRTRSRCWCARSPRSRAGTSRSRGIDVNPAALARARAARYAAGRCARPRRRCAPGSSPERARASARRRGPRAGRLRGAEPRRGGPGVLGARAPSTWSSAGTC